MHFYDTLVVLEFTVQIRSFIWWIKTIIISQSQIVGKKIKSTGFIQGKYQRIVKSEKNL